MNFAVCIAAGMLLLSPALAANTTKSSLMAQIMEKGLQAEAAGRVQPSAAVTRSGTLKIIGVVDNLSGLTGPIVATATFEALSNSGSAYAEQGSTTVHFKGKIGKFTIKLPFHWNGVDPNGLILYGVTLHSAACPTGLLLSAAESDDVCRRMSEFVSYVPLAMPTQDGATTAASVNMVQ